MPGLFPCAIPFGIVAANQRALRALRALVLSPFGTGVRIRTGRVGVLLPTRLFFWPDAYQ
jgi:hypothetical protein